MTPGAAAAAVKSAFAKPLTLDRQRHEGRAPPDEACDGVHRPGRGHALSASAGTNVHLVVSVHGSAVRATAAALARRFDHAPRNASLKFVAGKPRIVQDLDGTTLDQGTLLQRVVHSLNANVRLPIALHAKTRGGQGHRVEHRARDPDQPGDQPADALPQRQHGLARLPGRDRAGDLPDAGRPVLDRRQVGEPDLVPADPGRLGRRAAARFRPGPNNPLGTRWMGLSAPGVGIHGTDEPGSIGWNASHGCIRMQVVDSEWLFTQVRVGTTVFIV